MKKPDKRKQPRAYENWVRRQLRNWYPEDDRPGYSPRFNGVRCPDEPIEPTQESEDE
jgi:hypothetical protein